MTYAQIIRWNVIDGIMTYSDALDWLQSYGVFASVAIEMLGGLDNE